MAENGAEEVTPAEKLAAMEAVVQIERSRLQMERATNQQLAMELAIAQHRLAAATVKLGELEQAASAAAPAPEPDAPRRAANTKGFPSPEIRF